MSTRTPITRLFAIVGGAAVAATLAAPLAHAGEGDVRRCDSDPSAHTCRMGARFFSVGDFFSFGGLYWQVLTVNGGTYRVQIKAPDSSSGFWVP